MHEAAILGAADLIGLRIVGQVKRHQRHEPHPLRQGCQDAFAIAGGLLGCGHRWLEIGHHHGTAELARAVRQHAGHCRAVAQV